MDSSVIVRWLVQEEQTPAALSIAGQAAREGREVICPDLVYYEVASALIAKQDLGTEAVDRALGHLPKFELRFVPVSLELVRDAAVLARERRVSVYDAAFAVLARATGAELVTGDRRLHERLIGLAGLAGLRLVE